jgi:hypothetical protein
LGKKIQPGPICRRGCRPGLGHRCFSSFSLRGPPLCLLGFRLCCLRRCLRTAVPHHCSTIPAHPPASALTPPSRGRPASGPPITSNVRCAMRSQLFARCVSQPSRPVYGSWSACSSSVAAGKFLASSSIIAGAVSQPRGPRPRAARPAGVCTRRLRSRSERVDTEVLARLVRQSCRSNANGRCAVRSSHRLGVRIQGQMQLVKALFTGSAESSGSRLGGLLPSCSRWCTCVAPNPSVKGTSRKRAAPYVER